MLFDPCCGVGRSAACGWGLGGLLWGWYQTMYYIGEIDIEFRRREKSKILAVYIEK